MDTKMYDYLYYSHWGKWDNSDIVECKPGDNKMHDSKFSAMQEAYDSRLPEEYDEYQTQEEIDLENEQEFKYKKLMVESLEEDWHTAQVFIDYLNELTKGEIEPGVDLLCNMICKAAQYNGSEATVPDFVRLVRMAFEWKSKQ